MLVIILQHVHQPGGCITYQSTDGSTYTNLAMTCKISPGRWSPYPTMQTRDYLVTATRPYQNFALLLMTQKLPLETWTQILEQAARVPIKSPLQHNFHSWPDYTVVPHPDDINTNLTTRLALTLVCHQFRQIVRPMVYEVIHIHSLPMACRLSAICRDFFTIDESAIGPRVWTKYLMFQFDIDIDDPSFTSYFHIDILHILQHCAGIVGLGWHVHNARFPAHFPSDADMLECVPRGLQFFSFGNMGLCPDLPMQILKLNADSMRAIELGQTSFFFDDFKLITPLRNVTHLTMSHYSLVRGDIISPLLPSLTHLQISDPRYASRGFFERFKDTLVSLHLGFLEYHEPALIMGMLPKLEIFCFRTHDIGLDVLPYPYRSPRLKELCIRADDSRPPRSMEEIFLEVGIYIGEFRTDLLPALATITVSLAFLALAESRSKEDLTRACQKLAESLSSPNLHVTIDY